jgi:hypothetical protein
MERKGRPGVLPVTVGQARIKELDDKGLCKQLDKMKYVISFAKPHISWVARQQQWKERAVLEAYLFGCKVSKARIISW